MRYNYIVTGITYGISEQRGYRSHMEDTHAIYRNIDRMFFAAEIFDGHGGREAAETAARMLTPHFMHEWAKECEKPPGDRRSESEIMREAYLTVDAHMAGKSITSGTTVANLYIIENRFLAANTGDTRVIMGTKKGRVVLTKDHRPDLEEEKIRIENLGGEVLYYGTPRVQGILAVSRALGDTSLKPYVSSEPRVVEGYLGTENDYVILACDGVWDVLSPDDAIKTVRIFTDPKRAAEEISKKAIQHGSTDNITVIVLDLREYVKHLDQKKMEITKIIDYGL